MGNWGNWDIIFVLNYLDNKMVIKSLRKGSICICFDVVYWIISI